MYHLDVKYAIGDTVRFKHVAIYDKREDCTFCGCSGKIKGLDGTVVDCPKCGGTGYFEEEVKGEHLYTGTIRDIQAFVFHDQESYVLYRMAGWAWNNIWIAESMIVEVLDDVD